MSALYDMVLAETERGACLTWVQPLIEMARAAPTEAEAELHVSVAIKNLMIGSHAGRIGL